MNEIENRKLGNFGFLLEFDQGFLYQLAQLAESNLYLNKRMCAVFIRQLTESFFDTVINMEEISVTPKSDEKYEVISINYKQKEICRYFNNLEYNRPQYGKKAFPKWPGKLNDKFSRIECPEGEGLNRTKESLVDPTMKTIYVWDYIRKIGNAGSHAVLSESNMKWLEEKYLIEALRQLCNRMRIYFYGYFYGTYNQMNKDDYSVERQAIASGEIYYPSETIKIHKNIFDGILPNYDEKLYYTVMPKLIKDKGKNKWKNYVNKYSLIRKYETTNVTDVQQYLLHSQKAYLRLQQIGECTGIAKYSVLADLRNSEDYYVTSYEFDVEPNDISDKILEESGFYKRKDNFISIMYQFVKIMQIISNARIYHRSLSHNSIKICVYESGDVVLKIIDFELVKLFESSDENQSETVFRGINEQIQMLDSVQKGKNQCLLNVGQYGKKEWSVDTTEEEYLCEQERRTGMIMLNMLCADHFDNSKKYDSFAQECEIFAKENIEQFEFGRDVVEKVADIAFSLLGNTASLQEATDKLKEIL